MNYTATSDTQNINADGKMITALALKRIRTRLMNGSAIKPCNYNERKLAQLIIEQPNHMSFINFPDLMNDAEFCLEIAKLTLNPIDCENYFYQFINSNLVKKNSFRYQFVCALFLNENIYKLADLKQIIKQLGLTNEFEQAKNDPDLKHKVKLRLVALQAHEFGAYHYSGNNPKELRKYKANRNDENIFVKNHITGVEEILTLFECLTEEEKGKKQQEEGFFNFELINVFPST